MQVPLLLYFPAAQPEAEQEDAPADELWPLGQATHADDAAAEEYVSAAQLVHVAALVAATAVE